MESSKEVESRVLRGMRLPELSCFDLEIYQLMLNCWQLDTDERPTFKELHENIYSLKNDPTNNFVNFELYTENGYEPFREELEFDFEMEFTI